MYVKTGLQSYCDTSYTSWVSASRMWILENYKDIVEYWYKIHILL